MTSLLHAIGVQAPGRLEPTDLEILPGELVGLIGPNGSGKTTLLRGLAGIGDGQAESLSIGGEDLAVTPPARRTRLLSFLPATRAVVWPIPVRDVIKLGLTGIDPSRIDDLLSLFELRSFADRRIDLLSTGERSRVLLARALAASPRLLLLDEPFANLDPYWVLRLTEILKQFVREQGRAAIVSLHDLAQVERFNRLLLMDEGKLVADRPPADLLGAAELESAFRICRDASGWTLSSSEDPRSLP